VQTHTAKGNRLQAKVTTGVTQSATRTSLQEKLFTVFQMRIRTMLPR
jgi:hypothetical protein